MNIINIEQARREAKEKLGASFHCADPATRVQAIIDLTVQFATRWDRDAGADISVNIARELVQFGFLKKRDILGIFSKDRIPLETQSLKHSAENILRSAFKLQNQWSVPISADWTYEMFRHVAGYLYLNDRDVLNEICLNPDEPEAA